MVVKLVFLVEFPFQGDDLVLEGEEYSRVEIAKAAIATKAAFAG